MRTGPTARPPARSLIRGPLQRLPVRLATRAARHALSYEDPVSAATGIPPGPSGCIGGRKASSGQETTHWGRACAGGTGAEGGIGVGNHLLGQVISLPQWGLTCPSGWFPAPMRLPGRVWRPNADRRSRTRTAGPANACSRSGTAFPASVWARGARPRGRDLPFETPPRTQNSPNAHPTGEIPSKSTASRAIPPPQRPTAGTAPLPLTPGLSPRPRSPRPAPSTPYSLAARAAR